MLEHPLTRGLDLDDPATTVLRRRIVRDKPFLNRVYREWYAAIVRALPDGSGAVLELGSGAGFLADYVPGVITTEVFPCPGIRAVVDGGALPFADGTLRAIVMTDVFHHLPDAARFLHEAARCVRPGGRLVMIEPWVTPWSRLVYGRLHHEPFEPDAPEWTVPRTGPLSGANGALPWIVFARDRERFAREHSEWQIRSVQPGMPFRYLVSGGISLRSLSPGWTFGAWRGVERLLSPWMNRLGMFALIELERQLEDAV
jgi:SAM-dependent methyltransferase